VRDQALHPTSQFWNVASDRNEYQKQKNNVSGEYSTVGADRNEYQKQKNNVSGE
jgi:hypothetical protein